ncbi:MAG: ATP-binding protein [Eudoraea sp.]|nr:ATP-binding protein [Eudoraea sp.]
MHTKRIVITGGPGTGKTSVIKALEAKGFYSFHEIIRSMTAAAKMEGNSEAFITNPLAFVSDPYLFNQQLLHGRIAQFRSASSLKHPVVFYDRGIPDVLAYMNYFQQEFDEEFKTACIENQYDQVLLLPPWPAIYKADNERLESFEEALEIHTHLNATYRSFGYDPQIIPEGTVEERTANILKTINSTND